MRRYILFMVLMILCSLQLQAQNLFDFSGQIRPRVIIDNKDFNANTQPNSYSEMRTRFGVTAKPAKNLSVFLQVQDSRLFGSEPRTISNTKNLDFHQAYFQVNDFFELPVNLKVGRMEAGYGTERVMSKNNWNNLGRSFDGVTLQLDLKESYNAKIDFFAFRVSESDSTGDFLDENVIGTFVDLSVFKYHRLQPFLFYYNSTSQDYPFGVYNAGVYLTGKINHFSHQAEFISQTGEQKYGASKNKGELSAFFLGYNATYHIQNTFSPFISAGVEYYSGDDDLSDNAYKEFSRLFGAGHKYLGYMDYFPKNTLGVGLMDIHVKAGIRPLEKLKVKSAFNYFNSAEDYVLNDNTTSKRFGTEFDLIFSYDYNDNLNFQLGGGLFSPGDIFKDKFGGDTSTWFYTMAVVNL